MFIFSATRRKQDILGASCPRNDPHRMRLVCYEVDGSIKTMVSILSNKRPRNLSTWCRIYKCLSFLTMLKELSLCTRNIYLWAL